MAQLERKKLALEKLVDELMKDQPAQPIIRQLSNELGLDYSGDIVTQMNTVLQSMNSAFLQSNRRKDLER